MENKEIIRKKVERKIRAEFLSSLLILEIVKIKIIEKPEIKTSQAVGKLIKKREIKKKMAKIAKIQRKNHLEM